MVPRNCTKMGGCVKCVWLADLSVSALLTSFGWRFNSIFEMDSDMLLFLYNELYQSPPRCHVRCVSKNKDMCLYVHLRALFEDKTQILELCTTAAGKEGRHGPAEAGVWPLLSAFLITGCEGPDILTA